MSWGCELTGGRAIDCHELSSELFYGLGKLRHWHTAAGEKRSQASLLKLVGSTARRNTF
jgi:hypothetical protein